MLETFMAIGIVVSLIYYETVHLSPGGMITPAYLALYLDRPPRVLATLAVALTTVVIVLGIRRLLPVYGRRQFALTVSVAVVLKLMLSNSGYTGDLSVLAQSVGVIVPGLIANDVLKQTFWKTAYSIAVVTGIMYGILLIMNGQFR